MSSMVRRAAEQNVCARLRNFLVLLPIAILVGIHASATSALALPGSYSLTARAADPNTYDRKTPAALPCPAVGGRASSPIPGAEFATSLPSLAPQDLALGQIVPFEMRIKVNGSTAPEGGVINFKGGFDTVTTNGSNFGFDNSYGVYCAFVDTGDSSKVDPGNDAAVTSVSASLVSNEIQGTINVGGLNNGDTIIVEVWMVLKSSLPSSIGGNVHTRLISAATATGASINAGNQTIPLLHIGDFFDKKASVVIQKMDAPDPVEYLGTLTYNIEATNQSASTVANGVSIKDTMDSNTAFVSASVTDTTGSITTCSHDGSLAGGVVTCNLGYLQPLESVVVKIVATVLPTALPGPGGSQTCTGNESLCNKAEIKVLNDCNTSDNIVYQPTGVIIPGPLGALAIDKVPNADIVYSGTNVLYAYKVTNSGTYAVTQITVTDDKCSPVAFGSGDTNNNNELDPGEIWNYSCSQVLTTDTLNVGLAKGTDKVSSIALESSNDAFVNVINPSLSLVKTVDKTVVTTGETVTYTFALKNTGDDSFDQPGISDPLCSPAVYASGDTNSDSKLDPGETWSFTCSRAITQDTTNTAKGFGSDSLRSLWYSNDSTATVTIDDCPADPAKIAAGICGCGVADTDSDQDGTADCNETCPLDPAKTSAGICGCGIADTDTDHDGTADCKETCPLDPAKTSAGICGCGVADTDTDHDGTADCQETCPLDPAKTSAGICGCGIADTDTDHDGTADCKETCPLDPAKTSAGVCGCGVADTDTDHDGTPDCHDSCAADPLKIAPGTCGCGTADRDTNSNGIADCNESYDCAGVLSGSAKFDACGICGGNGSTCAAPSCVEQSASPEALATASGVQSAAAILRLRTQTFAAQATKCLGRIRTKKQKATLQLLTSAITSATLVEQNIQQSLTTSFTKGMTVCSNSLCSQVSTAPTKAGLNSLAKSLFEIQRATKVRAIGLCHIKEPKKKKNDPRKDSEDYYRDLLGTIGVLPQATTQCWKTAT